MTIGFGLSSLYFVPISQDSEIPTLIFVQILCLLCLHPNRGDIVSFFCQSNLMINFTFSCILEISFTKSKLFTLPLCGKSHGHIVSQTCCEHEYSVIFKVPSCFCSFH